MHFLQSGQDFSPYHISAMINQLEKFKEIHTLFLDVDGVLTDNRVLAAEDGTLLRSFHIRDGLAIKLGVRAGLRFFAITGGHSQGVLRRLENLGFTEIRQNVQDKLQVYEELISSYKLEEGGILYMGDDIPDYPVMRRVGMPVCPQDAVREVLDLALYVSPLKGGEGCVRDVIEKLLHIQRKWPRMELIG